MKQYILELCALILGVELIIVAPDLALSLEVIGIPALLLVAALAVLYLRHVYQLQPEPRSRFFGMLVSISARVELLGLWVGYLVVGRIGNRTGWFDLPVPPPNVSSPISGLVVLIWVTPPIFYAASIYMIRRRASSMVTREDELDRD